MWDVYLECMEHFDTNFSENWKVFCESRNEQKYKEYLREIEFPYRNTLNSSMLIAFCSLTEYVLADITKENVKGYEKKKKRKRGDWLVRNIKLLNDRGFSIDPNSEDVSLFSCYIKIRNCVVHNGGRISNSKPFKEAISAVMKYAQSGNYSMIKIKDDYLVLGGDLISDVVSKSEVIIDGILEKI